MLDSPIPDVDLWWNALDYQLIPASFAVQAEMREKYQNMTTELFKLYGVPEAEAKKLSAESFEGEKKIAATTYVGTLGQGVCKKCRAHGGQG